MTRADTRFTYLCIVGILLLAFVLNSRPLLYAAAANLADVTYLHSGVLPGGKAQHSPAEILKFMDAALRWKADHQPAKTRFIGLALLRSGNPAGAVEHLQAASAAGDLQATIDLAVLAIDQRDWQAAARYLDRADTRSETLANRFVDQLSGSGDAAGAISLGNAYAQLKPQSPQTYYRLANLYWATGQRANTVQALEQALRYDTQTQASQYRYQRARLNYLKGDHHQAAEDLEAYLSLQPDDQAALFLAGQVYLALDLPDKAESVLLAAIDLDERHYWSHAYLATAYREQGKLAAAAQQQRLASQLTPDPAASLELLAGIYHQMGAACLETETRSLLSQVATGEPPALPDAFNRMDAVCEK